MNFLQNKLLKFFIHFLLIVINFSNLFLTDILIYESTERISFNYNAMFNNVLFWVILSVHLLYIILTELTKIIDKKKVINDQAVETAIAREQIKLISEVTAQTKKGNFEKADNVIKIYDKLAERRNN